MEMKDLTPQLIWGCFHEITQVPRPSKREAKIQQYLLDFATKHNLEAKQDETGNILITKPATAGCEGAPVVILQSHMDMVCEKNSGTEHDFDNDPIETIIEGEWVRANGTTLGADNGIGMAASLAVLIDESLVHGKIEALFTVDEETGLTGAYGVKEGFFTGDYLLNLDSEDEAELFIGCSGGVDTLATLSYTTTEVPAGYLSFKIEVKNLLGGHSGCDISLARGNANKILNRFLWQCNKKYDMLLCAIDGGNLRNAIPREAYAVIAIPSAYKELVRVDLNLYTAAIQAEIGDVEPNFEMVMTSTDAATTAIEKATATNLMNALYAAPHGVMAMSRDMEGLVETSTNLASVKMVDGNKIVITTSQRSSVESEKWDVAYQVEATFALAGAEVVHGDGYPGWKPNLDSKILKLASEAYEELYNITPAVKAIHAGLECGLFLEKYPHLDMISFGPTLRGVHSPDEKMHIPAVEKFWNHLVLILEKLTQPIA